MLLVRRITGHALEDGEPRGSGGDSDSQLLYTARSVDGKRYNVVNWLGAFPGDPEDVIVPMLEVTSAPTGKLQNELVVVVRNTNLAEAGMGVCAQVTFERTRGPRSLLSLRLLSFH